MRFATEFEQDLVSKPIPTILQGKTVDSSQVPEWRAKYFDYKVSETLTSKPADFLLTLVRI